MSKILVTCPPMLRQIHLFEDLFIDCGFDITAPKVVQTLSVNELLELVPQHDGWIIGDDPATAAVFKAGKHGRLRAAVKWGVGVDNVDFDAWQSLGIKIENTPGVFGEEVADLAICYLIGLARDAFLIDREVRLGGWPKPSGISLKGKTAGVIGLGDIGCNIAARAAALGLHVIGWDPIANALPIGVDHKVWPNGVNQCDFLIFACSLNAVTAQMFNAELLLELKHGVRVINVSRGGLIDENALISGLKAGVVDSAALDVFEFEPLKIDSELRSFDRLIFGSHNGSNTADAVLRASKSAILLLKDFLDGNT